jgi:hypothetical protein
MTTGAGTSTNGAVAVYTPDDESECLDTGELECATYTVSEEEYQDESCEWDTEAYDP